MKGQLSGRKPSPQLIHLNGLAKCMSEPWSKDHSGGDVKIHGKPQVATWRKCDSKFKHVMLLMGRGNDHVPSCFSRPVMLLVDCGGDNAHLHLHTNLMPLRAMMCSWSCGATVDHWVLACAPHVMLLGSAIQCVRLHLRKQPPGILAGHGLNALKTQSYLLPTTYSIL